MRKKSDVKIGRIEVELMTVKQYDQAITALGALIGNWSAAQEHRLGAEARRTDPPVE